MGREVLRLTKGFLTVKFGADGHGLLVRLPAGAEVEVLGSSAIPGCVEIAHNDERFNMFEVDLRGHSSCPAALALVASGPRQWKVARSLQAV